MVRASARAGPHAAGRRRGGATSRLPFAGCRFNPNRGLEIEGRSATDSEGHVGGGLRDRRPGSSRSLRVHAGRRPRVHGRRRRRARRWWRSSTQAMARRFWPNRSPLGARLRQGDEPDGEWRTVVGVVADIRNDDADQPPIPYLYVPLAQRPLAHDDVDAAHRGRPARARRAAAPRAQRRSIPIRRSTTCARCRTWSTQISRARAC